MSAAGDETEGQVPIEEDGPAPASSRTISNLTVKVIDNSTEEPISQILIELYLGSMDHPANLVESNITNETGITLFDNILAAEYNISADHPDYHSVVKTINVTEGENKTVIIRMDRIIHYSIVRGTVYDNATKAILEGVNVSVVKDTTIVGWNITGADGKYLIKEEMVGNYTITASKKGYFYEFRNFTVPGLYADITVNLWLKKAPVRPDTGNITGFVYDKETGLFIQGATIQLYRPLDYDPFVSVMSDHEGEYFLNYVEGGFYYLVVWHEEYRGFWTNVTVVNGTTQHLNFTLETRPGPPGPGVITGNVTDNIGTPIPNAYVTRINHVENLSTYTDENGSFKIDMLEPGHYVFKVSAEGHISSITDPIYVDYDQTIDVNITLRKHADPVEPQQDDRGLMALYFLLIVSAIIIAIIIMIYLVVRWRRKRAMMPRGPHPGAFKDGPPLPVTLIPDKKQKEEDEKWLAELKDEGEEGEKEGKKSKD
jgi:protocatechuate 3,4-dioxygenase beta subunit